MRRILRILFATCFLLTIAALIGWNTPSGFPFHSGYAAAAPDADRNGYADDDVARMAVFLQNTEDGVTNAEVLGWTIDDPGTWEGVTWAAYDEVKRLLFIEISGNLGGDAPRLSGALNLSDCAALEAVMCDFNNLASIDVSGCTALTDLACRDNRLTELNVSGCTALTALSCEDNALTTLDVSECLMLTRLLCGSNQLGTLDVSLNTALKSLECQNNLLTALNISGCTALNFLNCDYNQLTTLDVSGCTALSGFTCDHNQLMALDVSACTALERFSCQNNQLTALDMSGHAALKALYCGDNQLNSLDVSGCTALEGLSCRNNRLVALDVSDCVALVDLSYEGDQPAAPDIPEPDPNQISFQYAIASPEWKPIGRFGGYFDYTMAEDGQGVLHLIYINYSMRSFHCFQNADGSWSKPRRIVNTSLNWQRYWVGIAPDGSLCLVWNEHESVPHGHTDVFHMTLYKDGHWREDSQTYDFKGAEGFATLSISHFRVAFDALGEPHFLYLADGDYDPPESDEELPVIPGGLFLDGTQLIHTQLGLRDGTSQKTLLVQGIGNILGISYGDMSDFPHLYIDSENVYHLMGHDGDSSVPNRSRPTYSRYLHSYSPDGGKTWQGPSTVFEDENGLFAVTYAADSERIVHLKVNNKTTALKPDAFEPETPQAHFGEEQMDAFYRGFTYEESLVYRDAGLGFVLLDGREGLHYMTGKGRSEPFYDMTQIGDNAWAIRGIAKPEAGAQLITMFLRRNGNFCLLAEVGREMEAELCIAEIPSEG